MYYRGQKEPWRLPQRAARSWKTVGLFLLLLTGGCQLLKQDNEQSTQQVKVLFIVTALTEFNNGARGTTRGSDRFGDLLTPVLVDNIITIVQGGFAVDVLLILGFTLATERQQALHAQLPAFVGLQVWHDATPLSPDFGHGYKYRKFGDKVYNNTMGLPRQARYAVKDKLAFYDIFAAFEDDMRVTGAHIGYFIEACRYVDNLKARARDEYVSSNEDRHNFFGQMSRAQLDHIIPGFIRVEVNEEMLPFPGGNYSTEKDFDVPGHATAQHVLPNICCDKTKSPDQLLIWETGIANLRVRELPDGEWVVLLPGPSASQTIDGQFVGGYWTGTNNEFENLAQQPSSLERIGQQAGWLVTQQQVFRLHVAACPHGFLPPYTNTSLANKGWEHDGLTNNVEFWSGGYHLFTGARTGCSMQRYMSMQDAHEFSKHLIFHVANNKHRTVDKSRFTSADDLWGQLNHVRKVAIRAKILKRAAKSS